MKHKTINVLSGVLFYLGLPILGLSYFLKDVWETTKVNVDDLPEPENKQNIKTQKTTFPDNSFNNFGEWANYISSQRNSML